MRVVFHLHIRVSPGECVRARIYCGGNWIGQLVGSYYIRLGDIDVVMTFFERQSGRKCGLHALRNLLRSTEISEAHMRDASSWCVEQSHDVLENHERANGDWSLETLKKVLRDQGYAMRRAASVRSTGVRWDVPIMTECMDDERVLGFIVQSNDHYACVRKHDQEWEFCDSLHSAPEKVTSRQFCTAVLYQQCNAFLVMREEEYI